MHGLLWERLQRWFADSLGTLLCSRGCVCIAELLIGGAEPLCPNPVEASNGFANIFAYPNGTNKWPQGTPGSSILTYFDLRLSVGPSLCFAVHCPNRPAELPQQQSV